MAWTKQAAAPDYAYPIEVLRALIVGTPDAWLSDWLWLLGGVPTYIPALCAAGPQECEPFTELDFLGAATSGNRVGLAINLAQLVPKLQCFAEQRLFGAYCENVTPSNPTASWHEIANTCEMVEASGENPTIWVGPPLPVTSTKLRVTVLSGPGQGLSPAGTGGAIHTLQSNIADTSPGETGRLLYNNFGTTNPFVGDFTEWRAGAPTFALYPAVYVASGHSTGEGPWCFTLEWWGPDAGGTETYDPPPVDQPPTAIAPPAGTYDTIADLGLELDLIERKLEILLDDAANRQVATLWPLVPAGAPFAVSNDDDIALPEGGGLVVAVTNIGNQTDETFGEPRRLHRLGRVTLGSADAWLPPVDITVTPMMLVGLPLEVRVARVHVMPPAVAQVQILTRANPVG